MNDKEQRFYDAALQQIEACRRERGTMLALGGFGLTHLPPEIGQLPALQTLYLNNNQLTTLPEALGQLTALQTLWLSNNQLTTLPPEIGHLKRLAWLTLEDNALRTLPESLKGLTQLVKLALHGNDALGLPAEVLGPRIADSYECTNSPAQPRAILDYYFNQQTARVATARQVLSAAPAFSPQKTTAPSPATGATLYDVFLSAKSEDYAHARSAAKVLREAGLRVFFSEQELPEVGNSDYFDAIDTALESARHMLVVTTSRAHVESKWVKKEWKTFLNEQLSGRKTGNLVTLLCGGMTIGDLPLSLRQHEARRAEDLPGLLNYFQARGA